MHKLNHNSPLATIRFSSETTILTRNSNHLSASMILSKLLSIEKLFVSLQTDSNIYNAYSKYGKMAEKRDTEIVNVVTNCDSITQPSEIEKMIFCFRGQQVMIDHDLATLYGVGTKVLN